MNSCSEGSCRGAVVAKSLCKKHYNALYWRTTKGTPTPRAIKLCSLCSDKAVSKGFCQKHYSAYYYETFCKGRPISPRKKRSTRDRELRLLYGITFEQYEYLAKKQKGLCAVCRNPPKNKYGLCVDHCHKSGRVRGLLCAGCNTALGVLERSNKWTAAAFKYLKTAAVTFPSAG